MRNTGNSKENMHIGVTVNKMHEFTDGCATQYKRRHCNWYHSCFVADFAFTIQHNYLETSHAKGNAAGSYIKQQASLAAEQLTLQMPSGSNCISGHAQSLFPSCSTAVSLKRRLFNHVQRKKKKLLPTTEKA